MKIHELLSDPKRWTRGSEARTSGGLAADAVAEDASCWCLTGAMRKCYTAEEMPKIIAKVQRELMREKYSQYKDKYCILVDWNDDPKTTFEKVRELAKKLDI